ncbi:hypothetical protein NDU88_004196 [Pleurodeles waltl]|uniref:Uncharacterized protein n=1 Tax=Pleurodeles waltl TaxID=8319 RepID=A0AAV7VJL7_PLEWA|nr:hypothetical protein NDU88_004196 [Pleurodeles waltl]
MSSASLAIHKKKKALWCFRYHKGSTTTTDNSGIKLRDAVAFVSRCAFGRRYCGCLPKTRLRDPTRHEGSATTGSVFYEARRKRESSPLRRSGGGPVRSAASC